MRLVIITAAILAACKVSSPSPPGSPDGRPPDRVDGAPGTIPDAAFPDAAAGAAPVAISVTPVDQASGIERDAAISVTFSADMRPETLDTSTFLVARGGAAVAGTVTYDAGTRTATFHPSTLLALLGDYSATITQGATDTSGLPLSEERTWSFDVRDGRWSTAELIVPDALWDSSLRVATDAIGRANLVWEQAGHGIRWARFEPTSGWQAPESLDPAGGWEVAIASDPAGSMIAAWRRGGEWPVPTSLYGTRFVPGSGWGPITLLEDDDAYGHHVGYLHDVASDPGGNFMVVWDQYGDDGLTHVWARRFVPASGWAAAALLGQGRNPKVAIDASGHATASWMQPNGTDGHDIVASHFDPAAGWSAPRTLDSDSGAGQACCVRLAAAAAGDVTAVWEQDDTSTSPTRQQVWTARWNGGDWSAATELDTGGHVVSHPELAGDPAGNQTVLWSEYADGELTAKSRRYIPGSGWDPATVIQTGALSKAIDIDPAGNGFGLWTVSDGTTPNLWAARFTPETGWSPAVRIDADEVGDTWSPPVIAVDDLGGAVVAWVRTIGHEGHCCRKRHLWRATFE